MGNDLDVCSKDTKIDEMFWEHHGPNDESSIQFFRRGYNKFCDSISSPKRKEYTESDLLLENKLKYKEFYQTIQFNMRSQDLSLQACLWKRVKFRNKYKPKDEGPLCIIYLHTNTKCVVDALEVLPVAHELDAHIVSFDLPGCGKSEGCLSGTIDRDIEHLIEWTQCIIDPNVKIIIWARGMSTAPALQYAENITLGETAAESVNRKNNNKKSMRQAPKVVTPAKAAKAPSKWAVSNIDTATGNTIDYNYNKEAIEKQDTPVVAMVLDSPFIGVQQMVTDGIEKFQGKGYVVPTGLITFCSRIMISALASRLGGLDPFSIHPIKQAAKAYIPCYIYSANEDDYIPAYHGDRVAAAYAGHVERMEFPGKHFTDRPLAMLMNSLPFLIKHAELEKLFDGEDEVIIEARQALESIKVDSTQESSLYVYSEDKYHDYFTDLTSSGKKSGKSTSSSSWLFGKQSASNSPAKTEENSDAELPGNPDDYEIKDLTTDESEDLSTQIKTTTNSSSSSSSSSTANCTKAEDIPKNVSFDNLMALAKSRSNTNLNKLGAIGKL